MAFKRTVSACIAICVVAILVIASCGCDDLGEYTNTNEYHASFADIVLISGTSREIKEYSVKEYFYNDASREDFLTDENGVYTGVKYSDYVYMAIPFETDIDMDTIALFLRSEEDVSVYINVFVTDTIPSNWRGISDIIINQGAEAETGETDETTETDGTDETTETTETDKSDEKDYDDPHPDKRIGELTVHLKKGKWDSFTLDRFNINGVSEESIKVKEDEYILLQIRNNSGVRIFDSEKQLYVDPQSGMELQRAEITMTNLLIRALNVAPKNEVKEGE